MNKNRILLRERYFESAVYALYSKYRWKRLFYLRDNTMLPYLYACAIAVICYATQAVVNLNLPVVTPFLWIFLSIMVAILRDKGEVING